MKSTIIKAPTPSAWVSAVLGDWTGFLVDHALCERKAMATALSLISRYPQKTALVEPMICLAKEELAHYHEVYRLISKNDISLSFHMKDPYVSSLRLNIRHSEKEHFLDRLLVSALIEARSSERFEILAENLEDPDLKLFYDRLARSEKGHWKIFHKIASFYYQPFEVEARFETLSMIESECMLQAPIRAAVH